MIASLCSMVLLPLGGAGLRTPYYATLISVVVAHSLCHFFYCYGSFTCCLWIHLFFLLCLPEGPIAGIIRDKTRDCFNLWNMYSQIIETQITHFIDKPQRHTRFSNRDVYHVLSSRCSIPETVCSNPSDLCESDPILKQDYYVTRPVRSDSRTLLSREIKIEPSSLDILISEYFAYMSFVEIWFWHFSLLTSWFQF